jgi:hypothetical protein
VKPFPIAVAAAALLAATGAVADPAVNGVAVNSTLANGNTNAAIGAFSRARQAIGVVNGNTQVNGAVANTTVANGNANVSTGTSRGDLPDWGHARFGR